MAKLTKAYVQPLQGRDTQPIEVLFNPAEYSLEKSNTFQANALPGMSSPVVQFVNGAADTLTMDLFFDTYTDHKRENVTTYTGRFAQLLEIDPDLHAPPPVKFIWGKFQFKAYIERLSQKFTMFTEDGTPVRATLNDAFKEYKTIREQLQEVPRNSADVTKRHVVEEGDSLWLLAHKEYQDARRWSVIAAANDLDDPRLLEIGRELIIPPLS